MYPQLTELTLFSQDGRLTRALWAWFALSFCSLPPWEWQVWPMGLIDTIV